MQNRLELTLLGCHVSILYGKVVCTRIQFVRGTKQVVSGIKIRRGKHPYCFFVVPASDRRSWLQSSELLPALFLQSVETIHVFYNFVVHYVHLAELISLSCPNH